jgi:hypothetical protein
LIDEMALSGRQFGRQDVLIVFDERSMDVPPGFHRQFEHVPTGYREIWAYPKTPKMNAHCERFNRTIQECFVDYHENLLLTDTALFNQNGRNLDVVTHKPLPAVKNRRRVMRSQHVDEMLVNKHLRCRCGFCGAARSLGRLCHSKE